MIAHKCLKVIGAVLLTVFLTVGMAVPCFASSPLPTDENGNWVPDRFYAYWSIYNTDSQSYVSTDVTSHVTDDGLLFTFPFNSTGVNRVKLYLITDRYYSQSNYYIDGLSFDGYAYYTNDRNTSGLVSVSRLEFVQLYYNGSSRGNYTSSYINSNPFSYTSYPDTPMPFIAFSIEFYCSVVSGTLSIHFDHILVNGEDISSKITVQNLDNASQDLTDLGEQLEVPKPTIQVANIVEDALEGADYQSVGSTTWSFMSNDLITKMLLITVSFALLGYILFGKKESGS